MSGAPSGLRLSSGWQLLGREREREALDRLLDGGRGGVLVVHGEPGIGKTALLEYAVETGREFRVAGICGVENEMELAFAARHSSRPARWTRDRRSDRKSPIRPNPPLTWVSEGGLEPPRPCGHQPLKRARLPIPPLRRRALESAPGDRSARPRTPSAV